MRKLALSVLVALGSLISVAMAADDKWDPYAPMPHDIVVGNPSAPITVVEYASLTCPHCGRFHKETMPSFKEQLVDTGQAKLIYRHLPLDQSALAGSLAASCASEDIRFEVVSTLFDQVAVWAPDIKKMVPVLQSKFGDRIDAAEMLKCASNSELANEIVNGMTKAIDNGVASTPTFFINGEKFDGFISPENFSVLVKAAGPTAPEK